MTKQLRTALKNEFKTQLKVQLSQFAEDSSQDVPSGAVLYSWRFHEQLTFYIFLNVHRMEDKFTIDLAWSTKNKLPAQGGRLPTDAPKDGGLMFRISHLMASARDHWWHFGREQTLSAFLMGNPDLSMEEKLSRVKPQVDDAIRSVVQHAIPYFQRVAAEQGRTYGSP